MIILFICLWLLSGFTCWVIYRLSEKGQIRLKDLNDDTFMLTMMGAVSVVIFAIVGIGKLWDNVIEKHGDKTLIKLPQKK